jgi:drug/metabolite transporter (DMT)-like permease
VVVAAVSAALLAGEALGTQVLIGGGLIMGASLLAARDR